jgi:hypothetical protein
MEGGDQTDYGSELERLYASLRFDVVFLLFIEFFLHNNLGFAFQKKQKQKTNTFSPDVASPLFIWAT